LKRDERLKDSEKRRDRHEIVAEILKTAVNGQIKTHIMYRARLSYSQINEYLPLLVERGFLENVKVTYSGQRSTVYRTTSKGMEFIENLELLNKLWTKNPFLNAPVK
jgi:predicted transcriptional regulator